jgi:hypothetical protein
MIKSIRKIQDWYQDRFSKELRYRIIQLIIFLVALTIGFGLGFIWRGEIQRTPIIIEKYSNV